MRIGFDGKRAVFNFTGLGNYSRTLIRALSAHYPNEEYFLFTPGFRSHSRLAFLEECRNVKMVSPSSPLGKLFPQLWRRVGVKYAVRQHGIALYHGLSNELPIGINTKRARQVVTIHDLIFRRFPAYYPRLDRFIYARKVRHACRKADRIIAVSEQTKRDLIEFERVDPSRVEVVYQSCDPQFARPQSEATKSRVRQRYNLPAQYLLFVGSIEERKNLLTLTAAVHQLRKRLDVPLVAIGNGGTYRQRVEKYVTQNNLKDRVTILDEVDFGDFPAIYQMALAFAYPSQFEGFGIPIIEALWSKTPVITTEGACFPEAGGPNSAYVPFGDLDALCAAIERVLTDSQLRARMIGGGYSYVQRFREESFASGMMNIYKRLVG